MLRNELNGELVPSFFIHACLFLINKQELEAADLFLMKMYIKDFKHIERYWLWLSFFIDLSALNMLIRNGSGLAKQKIRELVQFSFLFLKK